MAGSYHGQVHEENLKKTGGVSSGIKEKQIQKVPGHLL